MELVRISSQLFEVAGILAMLVGIPVAAWVAALRARGDRREAAVYRHFRQTLGRAILLGVDCLVAAAIIRTVSESPSLTSVAVLGLIVLIRTFLSFALEMELEGRWPWQQRETQRESAPAGPQVGAIEARPSRRTVPVAPRATAVYGSSMEPQHS